MMYVEATQLVGSPDNFPPLRLTTPIITCYAADMETSMATISVIQVTAINAGRVLALADVELILDGVSFSEQACLVRAIGSPRDDPARY